MQGKYDSSFRFQLARLQRGTLRAALRPLVTWNADTGDDTPGETPAGYTVIIGALGRLPEVARANLRMLHHQHRDHLHEVIVVFDEPRDALPADFEQRMRDDHPDLPLRCLFYTRTQTRVLRTIGWGWCYSWLSWSIGIGACRTQYALLHDLDALLLRPDVLEERYHAIAERGDQYLGRKFYKGNGIDRDDALAVTFELMFDAQWVRRTFKPVDLFNHVGWFRGRRVEFDTFLHAQSRAGRASVLPIEAEHMVHPSQVFCQYTELMNRRRYVPPEGNNLPMLAYLLHLGGHETVLRDEIAALARCRAGEASLFGRTMDIAHLTHRHLDWLVTQVARVEAAVVGAMRPEVQAYFDALRQLIVDPPTRGASDGGDRASAGAASGAAGGESTSRAIAVAGPVSLWDRLGLARLAYAVEVEGPPAEANACAAPRPGGAAVGGAAPRPRVTLHGVGFDVLTEPACAAGVLDALERDEGGWIITPNLDHVRRAQRDADFASMLHEADVVVADGMPLVWASRLQGTPLPERVAGSSLVSTLAAGAAERGRSLFLLGGEPGAAEASAKVLCERYPGLKIAGTFCPPMGFEADEDQVAAVRQALLDAGPDIVYVALGSPKQERLIRKLRAELPRTWWIGVGISLSFLCGRVKRAPLWVQRLGLEWVHRLAQEPRRLARRYLVDGLPFAARLLGRAAWRRMRGGRATSRVAS